MWEISVVLLLLALSLLLLWGAKRANEVDWGHRWVNVIDGGLRLFCRYYHGLRGDTLSLPPSGPAIVVANHISGLDPLLLIAASRRPLRFMIAREEYERFGLQWLFRAVGCIPVDRSNRPDLALREALKALEDGEVVALFPHGRIIRKRRHGRPLKAGAVRLAARSGAAIYPAYLDGVLGRGLTLLSLPLPSRARLTSFASFHCQEERREQCLEYLAQLLNGDIVSQVADENTQGSDG